MATDYAQLVPKPVAAQVVASVSEQQSAVMQLATQTAMPSGVETVPVVTGAPAAGFVDPAYGGLKPSSDVTFDGLTLTAEELAVVLPIPNAYIDDASYPVWPAIEGEVSRSFARVFDAAAISGTNAPASWPAGGLIAPAVATPVTGLTALEALDNAFTALEASGVPVDGVLGGSELASAVRKEMASFAVPAGPPVTTLWGVRLVISSNWPAAAGLCLVGGFADVIVGVRQDVRFELSDSAVISDAAGAIVVNAWQADSTILRSYLRAGLAVAHPIGSAGTPTNPLALASVTAGGATAAAAKAKA